MNHDPIKVGPIRRGVPMPPKFASMFSQVSQAVFEMQEGDHREIDGPQREIGSKALTAAKRFGYKITTRKLNGHGVGIWRLK